MQNRLQPCVFYYKRKQNMSAISPCDTSVSFFTRRPMPLLGISAYYAENRTIFTLLRTGSYSLIRNGFNENQYTTNSGTTKKTRSERAGLRCNRTEKDFD